MNNSEESKNAFHDCSWITGKEREGKEEGDGRERKGEEERETNHDEHPEAHSMCAGNKWRFRFQCSTCAFQLFLHRYRLGRWLDRRLLIRRSTRRKFSPYKLFACLLIYFLTYSLPYLYGCTSLRTGPLRFQTTCRTRWSDRALVFLVYFVLLYILLQMHIIRYDTID